MEARAAMEALPVAETVAKEALFQELQARLE
jgi:hypothetical protein